MAEKSNWIQKFRRDWFKGVLGKDDTLTKEAFLLKNEELKKLKSLYRFRSFNLESLLDFHNDSHWFSESKELNDPMEDYYASFHWDLNLDSKGRKASGLTYFRDEFLNDLISYQDLLICSFTSNLKSKSMWSHYLNGYRGFAIEYDTQKLIEERISLVSPNFFPVLYTRNPLEEMTYYINEFLDFFGIQKFEGFIKENFKENKSSKEINNLAMENFFKIYPETVKIFECMLGLLKSIKTPFWKEEREWRAFNFKKPNPKHPLNPRILMMNDRSIKSLHVGYKMNALGVSLMNDRAYRKSKDRKIMVPIGLKPISNEIEVFSWIIDNKTNKPKQNQKLVSIDSVYDGYISLDRDKKSKNRKA